MNKDTQTPTQAQANIPTPGARVPFADPEAVTKKDRMLIGTIVIIILILAAFAVIGFLCINPAPDTIQGQAESTEVRISGKLPGRVEEIYVEEGQMVHAGDTLIRIKSTLADAKMNQASSLEKAAAAANRKVDAGTRRQIVSAAQDIWRQAQAASGIAQKTYERVSNLYREGVVSAQKRDEAKAAYDAAKAAENAAKSQYELAASGPTAEDRQASAAMLGVAKGGVAEVTALLEDQYLVAPCDGEITVIYPNVSELIAMGAPVMSLQKNDHWATFNVRETSLKDMRSGSVLRVWIPALDTTVNMKVFYVRNLGTYANWQATKATGDFDARTFQVKARPEHPIADLRPGMSVVFDKVVKK